jgi:hypothetical protein
MSYLFESKDTSLWSPSNTVAGIFLSQLQILADLINTETGFEETMGSVFEINPHKLGIFLAATARYLNGSNNQSLKALLRPVVIHLMAIHSRCESASPNSVCTSFEHDWILESNLLAEHGMPR